MVNYNRLGNESTEFFSDKRYGWQLGLNLTAGRFVADDWFLGMSVAGRSNFAQATDQIVAGQQQPIVRQNVNLSVAIMTTPFVRRYWQFTPVQVFVGAGLSVESSETNQESTGNNQDVVPFEQRSNSLAVSPYLEAGVNYFLTNRFALQLSASTQSLPFSVAGVNTGLVYWTGSNRKAGPLQTRENVQTNRGNWIVEGGFSADNEENSYSEVPLMRSSVIRRYNISPSAGHFIRKNSVLGISIPQTYGNLESSDQNTVTSSRTFFWTVSISPYYQHYWSSTRLTPYTRLSVAYQFSGFKGASTRGNGVSAGLDVGLAYMLGRRFIIETSLANASFIYSVPLQSGFNYRSWDANLSVGLRGSFAVRYVLTRPD